jgi:tRNA threonylcarbamoyladenosine biosynthesis protein TsaE
LTQKKTYSLKNIGEISEFLFQKLKNGGVLTLTGDLGAGKTTLAKEIGKSLQIDEKEIKSPTYTYLRRYPEKKFFHADLYRIKNEDQIAIFEIIELLENPKNIIIIEWPEILEEILPENTIKAKIRILDEHKREIEIT